MTASARIAHGLPGRTRLRIPSRRGEEDYFARIVGRLSECAGVTQVESNSRTGSVLIRHIVPFPRIATFAADNELFVVQADDDTATAPYLRAAATLARLDAQLIRLSGGQADFRSLVFISLLAMSLVQLYRGQIMAPATTLLWYALNLRGGEDGTSGRS